MGTKERNRVIRSSVKSPYRRFETERVMVREVPLGPMPGFPLEIPRCVIEILIKRGPASDSDLIMIAAEMKNRVLSLGKHYCAMAFHFWHDREKIGKEEAVAVIDYAPGGRWEDALKAKIGEYTQHTFKLIHNRTGG